MIPSQFFDSMGKFDASKVDVTEAEIDLAIHGWLLESSSYPSRRNPEAIARQRRRARWNIALGKANGSYCEHEDDTLPLSQRKGAA